jgi:hypothetical protein
VLYAATVLITLAGFFNFTIYIRPRFLRHLEESKHQPSWWSLAKKTLLETIRSREVAIEIEDILRDPEGQADLSDDSSEHYLLDEHRKP